MNAHIFWITIITVLLSSLSGAALLGQSGAASRSRAPLGLFRLGDALKPGQAPALAAGRFAVDDLSIAKAVEGGASKARQGALEFLVLAPNKPWSVHLRGTQREPTFASFLVHGSETTFIEVAGARLGVTAGPVPGSLQLMFDDSTTGSLEWKSLNLHVPTSIYGGKPMAALPVLTVHVDPIAGVWHLYSGSRLLADHLPLIASQKDDRRFKLTAGNGGAWICGLVLADENPLYVDDNFNGVDDAFERQKRGVLLPVAATLPDRKLLATQWRDAQRARHPVPLAVLRPLPDRK